MRGIDLLPALKGRDSLKQRACEAGARVEGRFPFHRSLKLLHGRTVAASPADIIF